MLNIEAASQPVAPSPTGSSACATGLTDSFAPNVKVWLVDDDDELRALIAELLVHQGGIDCVRHFSSPDALLSALASKPGPDVILRDVQMGDRNGLDAVRPIKSLTRSTRVLMFTTCFNHDWRERAFREGSSDYLLKTDPWERVAERIRCPANDPAPRAYARRRSKPVVNAAAEKPPRLLHRTLERFRSLWN